MTVNLELAGGYMCTLDELIRKNDKDDKVKDAIVNCFTENMTKE